MQWFKVVGTKNCVFVSLREQLKFDLLTLPSRNPCNQDTFRLHAKLSQMMVQMSVHQFIPVFITHLSPKRMMHYRNYRSSFGKFLNTNYKLCLAFFKIWMGSDTEFFCRRTIFSKVTVEPRICIRLRSETELFNKSKSSRTIFEEGILLYFEFKNGSKFLVLKKNLVVVDF